MYNPKLVKKEIAPDFFGVFASEDIEEGELIFTRWNDSCTRLTKQQVKKLKQPYKEIFEKYSTEISEFVYVGPYENEDVHQQIDYFINHSCDPTTWLINDDDVAARRNIKAGEQVTIDYATFIINEFESSRIERCLCGSAECRGKFSKGDWWRLRNRYRGHFISWIQDKINQKERLIQLEKIAKVNSTPEKVLVPVVKKI
ncbi:MAG: SET domain-containing protein-lysine N-methyltransferase [Cytophagaceae bacterium]